MLRSMFAAVSGLRNHQTMMDVIGNNIANVNTTGFKSSSVVFENLPANAPGMIEENMSLITDSPALPSLPLSVRIKVSPQR